MKEEKLILIVNSIIHEQLDASTAEKQEFIYNQSEVSILVRFPVRSEIGDVLMQFRVKFDQREPSDLSAEKIKDHIGRITNWTGFIEYEQSDVVRMIDPIKL